MGDMFMEEFLARRIKIARSMPENSIALLPGAKTQFRNSSVEYQFRQDSDFYYLTGFTEANAFMALCKNGNGQLQFVLFNEAADIDYEIWNGKRIGQEDACKIYNADIAYDIAEIDTILPNLLANKKNIYYPLAVSADLDLRVTSWLRTAKCNLTNKKYRESTVVEYLPDTVIDLMPFIHELRLIKSEEEIFCMRKAAEISAQAHLKLMKNTQPGQMEYQLEAIFNECCLQAGCRGFAYQAIVAGGNNSCTLHYTNNDRPLVAGDLVLVDAGGEYNFYASDITRTFPVSGKFTHEQKLIYELVLEAQLAGISKIKPGNTYDSVQLAILEVIVNGLLELGIMHGDAQQIIQAKTYTKFYMHSSGHWLGLDVHDPSRYKVGNKWRKFEPGMVLTVEPGIYIANTMTDIDAKWRGIGIRIEDDVLVTKKDHEVLSSGAPKTVAEIESAAL